MDWEDYEELIKQVFVAKGYNVERIGGHGSDGGIDLVVKKKMNDQWYNVNDTLPM